MVDIATVAVLVFVILVVLAIFLSGIKILKEWERAPLLTLGRYRGLRGPGIIYVPPFISKIPYIISTRLQVASFRTEQTLTRDNVPVNVDAVMYFQPVDVQKAVPECRELQRSNATCSPDNFEGDHWRSKF